MRRLTIDLNAVASNLEVMRKLVNSDSKVLVMGVVKANAYGHGMVQVARKLEAEGIDYLGVADVEEALTLRAAGIKTRILAWLHDPTDDFQKAVAQNIDLAISANDQLLRVAKAAEALGTKARIHVKVDTGLGRNGVTMQELPELLDQVSAELSRGTVATVGIFSHLSSTGVKEDLAQIAVFDKALELAEQKGLEFELRHLTASDGTLSYPQARYDMVRIGVALYGLSPFSDNRAKEFGLTPAMTCEATVVQTKRVPAGSGVSYGYLYTTSAETTLALVPIGYAEGLPRHATGGAEVSIGGRRFKILSRIAMDQFVVDVGDASVAPGDTVLIFGPDGPTADDLADASGSINYEIVTRMGGRFKREYLGSVEG
ncbi:MAG: alanine racemase [Microbacteriaceae bacterium]|nr:alanine racemase [Microbacteriaceae bacterium]